MADEQVSRLVESIELGEKWLEEVLAIIAVKDQAAEVVEKRKKTQDRLRRMARAYVDGLIEEAEYSRQKTIMGLELESLVVPEVQAAEQAGTLIQNLPRLWELANETERRKLLTGMLDAVYIDTRQNQVIAIKPKPPFRPVFQVAASRVGSDIRIVNEPYNGSSLFLVETGESRTPRPEEAAQDLLQA